MGLVLGTLNRGEASSCSGEPLSISDDPKGGSGEPRCGSGDPLGGCGDSRWCSSDPLGDCGERRHGSGDPAVVAVSHGLVVVIQK